MERPVGTDALFESLAQVAKGMAHPHRLKLLELLAQGERSVDVLASSARLQVTTASALLQTLHRAGLVQRRREGQRVLYRLAGDDVAALLVAVRSVAQRHIASYGLAREALLGHDVPVVDVGRDELVERARRGELLVLDVRPTAEFAAGHIPGARSLPLDELADRLSEVPEDVEVVAYCRGELCVMSYDAAALLREHGRPASVLAEGILEWRAAGRPTEADAA